MDHVANPFVQVQDMPSSSDIHQAEPEEIWTEIRRTVSKMIARSKLAFEEKELHQEKPEFQSYDFSESSEERSSRHSDGESSIPTVDAEDDFPEGGLRAWLVVASA